MNGSGFFVPLYDSTTPSLHHSTAPLFHHSSSSHTLFAVMQLAQVKLAGELAHKAVFLALHVPPGHGLVVVVAAQMQEAVDDAASQFGLPRGAEPARLRDDKVNANHDLAREPSRFAGIGVIERDDIGRARVA